jgi:dihydroorotase
LCLPLPEALAAMTINPARAMKRPELAELKEGRPANITVPELLKEDVTFVDFFNHTLKGKGRLVCRWLINKGKIVREKGPARSAKAY